MRFALIVSAKIRWAFKFLILSPKTAAGDCRLAREPLVRTVVAEVFLPAKLARIPLRMLL